MNPTGFPDWNISADLPLLAHKNNPFRLDGNELVELLWENGQVVLHSQTQTHEHPKPGQVNKPVDNQSFHRNSVFSSENPIQSNNLIQEDAETVSWTYCPVDHPFDKESFFLPEFPNSDQEECPEIEPQKLADQGFRSNFASHHPSLPPRFHHVFNCSSHSNKATTTENAGNGGGDGLVNKESSGFRSSNKGCSSVTVASSHCGSNQVMVDAADTSRVSSSGIGGGEDRGFSAVQAKDQVSKMSSHGDRAQTEALETANTSSSSGGSDTSFGKTCNKSGGTSSLKRKSRCGEDDSACQSKLQMQDDAELESAPIKKPWSSRKSRAAEVHNLSERRRRDRINEKMKALQELLPQSNKTDKASMLDEAIEYMKSLQLQLQMMWMGSGMAPFMFPGVQHYMSRLGMGLGQTHPMPLNPMHFPRLPLVDQARIPPPPDQAAAALLFNPFNYQLQNPNVINPEQFANFMQYHHPLQSASQKNVFSTFGPKTPTNSHMIAPPGNNGPSAG